MKLIVFKGRNGLWRWHIRAKNGKLIATSGESFDSKGNALRAIRSFVRNMYVYYLWEGTAVTVKK